MPRLWPRSTPPASSTRARSPSARRRRIPGPRRRRRNSHRYERRRPAGPGRQRMERRELGRSGLKVAPWALGGNVFGWTADEKTGFALLDAFVDMGFNLIDT